MNDTLQKELKEKMPQFLEAVHMVEDHGADCIITTVFAFTDSPELLYKALRYAAARGITVQFVADKNNPLLQVAKKAD